MLNCHHCPSGLWTLNVSDGVPFDEVNECVWEDEFQKRTKAEFEIEIEVEAVTGTGTEYYNCS